MFRLDPLAGAIALVIGSLALPVVAADETQPTAKNDHLDTVVVLGTRRSDLTALQGKYSYVNYLTTDPDGRPMFYGSRAAVGSAYGSVCDVLDTDGKVVLQGLSSCTGYYSNSLNALPDHVFAAQGASMWAGWTRAATGCTARAFSRLPLRTMYRVMAIELGGLSYEKR
jgi:hypothetical protein